MQDLESLFKNPTRLLHLLSSKYSDITEEYETLFLDCLIDNKPSHFLSQYIDVLCYDTSDELLKRIYDHTESLERIPRLAEYYKNYHLFYCRPVFCDWKTTVQMRNYGDNRAELFYKNNYGGGLEKKSVEQLESQTDESLSSFDNKTNNETIFDKNVRNRIDNNIITTMVFDNGNISNSIQGSELYTKRSTNESLRNMILGMKKNNNANANKAPSNSNSNIGNNNKKNRNYLLSFKDSLCTLTKTKGSYGGNSSNMFNTNTNVNMNTNCNQIMLNTLFLSPKLKPDLSHFKANMAEFKRSKANEEYNANGNSGYPYKIQQRIITLSSTHKKKTVVYRNQSQKGLLVGSKGTLQHMTQTQEHNRNGHMHMHHKSNSNSNSHSNNKNDLITRNTNVRPHNNNRNTQRTICGFNSFNSPPHTNLYSHNNSRSKSKRKSIHDLIEQIVKSQLKAKAKNQGIGIGKAQSITNTKDKANANANAKSKSNIKVKSKKTSIQSQRSTSNTSKTPSITSNINSNIKLTSTLNPHLNPNMPQSNSLKNNKFQLYLNYSESISRNKQGYNYSSTGRSKNITSSQIANGNFHGLTTCKGTTSIEDPQQEGQGGTKRAQFKNLFKEIVKGGDNKTQQLVKRLDRLIKETKTLDWIKNKKMMSSNSSNSNTVTNNNHSQNNTNNNVNVYQSNRITSNRMIQVKMRQQPVINLKKSNGGGSNGNEVNTRI